MLKKKKKYIHVLDTSDGERGKNQAWNIEMNTFACKHLCALIFFNYNIKFDQLQNYSKKIMYP